MEADDDDEPASVLALLSELVALDSSEIESDDPAAPPSGIEASFTSELFR